MSEIKHWDAGSDFPVPIVEVYGPGAITYGDDPRLTELEREFEELMSVIQALTVVS